MKLPRPLLVMACVAGIAGPTVANACLQPSERTAIEVRTLQSRLMVGALACQQQDAYNAFVRRNQGDLNGAYRTAESHFRRTVGAQGQRRWNATDTDIAAAQSQEHTRLGSFFCRDTQVFFTDLGSVSGTADLARFAIERNLLQAYVQPTCTGAAAGRAHREPASRSAARPARR